MPLGGELLQIADCRMGMELPACCPPSASHEALLLLQ